MYLKFVAKTMGMLLQKLRIIRYRIERLEENPSEDQVEENVIYLVGGRDYVKWAYLKCPCGCNDVIMLSLIRKKRPSWVVRADKIGRPTISPSIWKTDGCKSHFIINKGTVQWARFEYRP